ncbi:carbohydrate ABC transporter permease [Breznakiella homolactica]|uniref:Maltose/maltodextrin transport system permease protein MalG n=1 Tax=Breznakiella homolactica TaxID=2798577 RepID=A0A7T7XLD1_9SPIR|nr:carbohydrate ABC transporter permease [Breznakiella homolactica]QQO08397.1 carbohydrate ABC transporter permease [Breznakiella homolactica]
MARSKFLKGFSRFGFYLLIIIVSIFIVLPFVMMVTYSLRTSTDIFSLDVSLFPSKPTLAAYKHALFNYSYSGYGFLTWSWNSLAVNLAATFLATFFAAMCGYAISRFKFTGKPVLWFIIMLTQTVPWIVILIPYYITIAQLGMVNKLWSLSLTYLAVFLPTSTWLFVGFFNNIPIEIEEAAKIDGCSVWRIFFSMIIPLSISAIASIALVAFVSGWGDYLFSSVMIKSASKWTMPLGLTSFRGEHTILWAEIMAMSVIVTLPIVVLFIYLQRYLVSLMAGGVKQ